MIALPPVDPADFIMQAGDEMQKCINKYFSEISLEEASSADVLDPKYSPDLLKQIQAEYYQKLENIWASIPSYYHSSYASVAQMPPVDVAGDPEALKKAYQAAVKRSFWEKIGKSNYKDVMEYKSLLKQYAENLLVAMHHGFVDAVANKRR